MSPPKPKRKLPPEDWPITPRKRRRLLAELDIKRLNIEIEDEARKRNLYIHSPIEQPLCTFCSFLQAHTSYGLEGSDTDTVCLRNVKRMMLDGEWPMPGECGAFQPKADWRAKLERIRADLWRAVLEALEARITS